jgi:hypothetical protein
MADTVPPTRWAKGDTFSASHHNETTDVARKRNSISVTGGQIRTYPHGTHIDVTDTDRYPDFRYGFIVATGPNGEPDGTQEGYWVKTAFMINATTSSDLSAFHPDPLYSLMEPYPALVTNLYEIAGHTHKLAPVNGTKVVRFWREWDEAGNARWTMNEIPETGIFRVDVVKDGGSLGANPPSASACTATYTVKAKISGTVLGTTITPEKGRDFVCLYTVATKGIAEWDYSTTPRTIVLWDTDEKPTSGACS